jgi:hypothetical protein
MTVAKYATARTQRKIKGFLYVPLALAGTQVPGSVFPVAE